MGEGAALGGEIFARGVWGTLGAAFGCSCAGEAWVIVAVDVVAAAVEVKAAVGVVVVVAFVVEQIVLEDVGEGVAATDDEPLETADGVCAAALYCHEGTD